MQPPAIPIRQTRDLGDVLNVTFQFMRQNARLLGKSLLFILGPPAFLCMAGFTLLLLGIDAEISDSGSSSLMIIWGFALLFLAGIPLQVLPSAVTNSVVVLYQDAGPGNFHIRDVWLTVRGVFWSLIGAMFCLGVLYVVLVFVSIIPCLGTVAYMAGVAYIAATFGLVFPMLVREDVGVFEALGRCPALVKEHWWETFGVVFIANFLYYLIIGIAFVPTFMLFIVADFHDVDLEGSMSVLLAALGAFGFLVLVVLRVVPELAMAFQYYNLVEHKERVGLMARIEQMEAAPGTSPDAFLPPAEPSAEVQ